MVYREEVFTEEESEMAKPSVEEQRTFVHWQRDLTTDVCEWLCASHGLNRRGEQEFDACASLEGDVRTPSP